MQSIRRVLFWLHLAAGVAAGLVILMMSATGVALTYQKQMQRWADLRGVHDTPPSPGARPLAADSLLATVVARTGKAPTTVTWRSDTDVPVEVVTGRERAYVSRYTGEVLSTGNQSMRDFMSKMTSLHRWFALEGESRDLGRKATGISNVLFLGILLTGMWLWWPRRLSWRALRNNAWLRTGLSSKARDFNWHHVLGAWSVLPLVVIVASGAVISYPWASALVYKAVGEAPPAPQGGGEGRGSGGEGGDRAPRAVVIPEVGDVAAQASRYVPEWRSASMAWPRTGKAPLVFTLDAGSGGEPQKRGTLTIPRDGGAVEWKPFSTQTPGRRARSWMRFLHTGEALGIVGQTVAGLVSLAAVILVYTGLALTWRRARAWLGRNSRDGARRGREALIPNAELELELEEREPAGVV